MIQYMSEGEAHLLHLELDGIEWRVRHALNNLDDLSKRNELKWMLEIALTRLDNLMKTYEAQEGDKVDLPDEIIGSV